MKALINSLTVFHQRTFRTIFHILIRLCLRTNHCLIRTRVILTCQVQQRISQRTKTRQMAGWKRLAITLRIAESKTLNIPKSNKELETLNKNNS